MKLKKIASLMLAGVMAVSMLAGCNTMSETPVDPDDDQGTTVPVTGCLSSLARRLIGATALTSRAL